MIFGWLRGGKRAPNIKDRFFIVVDETAPDPDDPALLIHVVDLRAENVPSIARRSNRWQSNPQAVDYFHRTGNDPGLRPVSRSEAGDIAKLWGAPWPPTNS